MNWKCKVKLEEETWARRPWLGPTRGAWPHPGWHSEMRKADLTAQNWVWTPNTAHGFLYTSTGCGGTRRQMEARAKTGPDRLLLPVGRQVFWLIPLKTKSEGTQSSLAQSHSIWWQQDGEYCYWLIYIKKQNWFILTVNEPKWVMDLPWTVCWASLFLLLFASEGSGSW